MNNTNKFMFFNIKIKKQSHKSCFLPVHRTGRHPEYVLPPVPYNSKPYTKDIMPLDVVLPLKTIFNSEIKCKQVDSNPINFFADEFNYGYYEVEIDLKQIDPIIQSIDKFISSYKTIEISNLNNLQVECGQPNIENFIPNRNVDLCEAVDNCNNKLFSLSEIKLLENGYSQTDKVNFKFDIDNLIVLNSKEIPINDIKTLRTGYTNGLSPSKKIL